MKMGLGLRMFGLWQRMKVVHNCVSNGYGDKLQKADFKTQINYNERNLKYQSDLQSKKALSKIFLIDFLKINIKFTYCLF